MIPLPNRSAVLTIKDKIQSVWASYLQQFTQAPPAFMTVTVGVSPFSYTASEPGNLALNGGTVTALTLTRGSTVLTFGAATNRFIPMAINDTVRITYTVLPSVHFIPSYGQNTNG